jgi:uncharacterized protein
LTAIDGIDSGKPRRKETDMKSSASLLFILASILPVHASTPRITVTGFGEILAYPDQADVILQTEITRPRIKQAMQDVQVALRIAHGICGKYASDPGDLGAGQISVEKEYRWVKNSNVFVGYRAAQGINLKLKDLGRLGALLEELSEAKSTRLEGVQYGHSAMDSLGRAAESAALANARRSAEALAKGLGSRLGEPIEISNVPPSMDAFGAATPAKGFGSQALGSSDARGRAGFLVEPGRMTVHGRVYAIFAMRPGEK